MAMASLVEQGLQVFSAVYEGVTESLSCELDKIMRLNAKYMDPVEYYSVMDDTGTLEQYQSHREDYTPDLQIMPICDPKQATMQQRHAKAEAELQAAMNNPLTAQSPLHLYNAWLRYFKAIGHDDIDAVLPYPWGNQRVDDPMMENMMALQPVPMMPMAFPDQDHAMHNQIHMLAVSQDNEQHVLTPLQRDMLTKHIEAHERLAKSGVMPNAGQGGAGNVDAQSGIGAPIGGAPGAVQGGRVAGNTLDGSPASPSVGSASGQGGGGPVRPQRPMGGRVMQ